MEEIDRAYESFTKLLKELETAPVTLFTEQDARVHVIDRVFLEVLGYPHDGLATEQAAGPKFLDYKFSLDGVARLIVEAKRDGRELGLQHRESGRSYLLGGVVFKTEAAVEGINQAISYCGRKNVELACVTNGREWVVFRGSRLGDGKDSIEGMGYSFSSLDGVRQHFKLFYDLLSPEAVRKVRYRAILQEAEGQPIRPSLFNKPLRHHSSANLLDAGAMDNDIERVMTSFFRKLSGDADAELLRACFVTSPESEQADKRLIRIADDLIGRIKPLNTESGDQLTSLFERALKAQRNEFVLIVGLKGTGKSTFIDRFFTLVLPPRVAEQCVVVRIDLSGATGHEDKVVEWLDQQLVVLLERAIFGDDFPTDDELQGMYWDEYARRKKGTGKYLYQKDKTQFKIEFGTYVERRRTEHPHDYILRMIRHVVVGRKKMPCIVFDNADHFSIDFQERVFQFARSIFEGELCMMIVPITDKTSWHLSQQGALQSFDSETLFLPVPEPNQVIAARIEYLDRKIKQEKQQSGGGYFFGRGIELDIDDLNRFVGTLQSVFIQSGPTSDIIEYLSNRDVRRCLEIARDIVSSGHLRADQLLKSYIVGQVVDVDTKRILRAIIKKRYDIFVNLQHKYVHNIFDMASDVMSSPLLALRILRLLRDAQKDKDDPAAVYVPVDRIVNYFADMTIDIRAIQSTLVELLQKGLVWSYDPTVLTADTANRIEIAPAGYQHLLFGMSDWVYMEAMVQVTPLRDEGVFSKLRTMGADTFVNRDARLLFVTYLISEDQRYTVCPDHISYASQSTLVADFARGAGAPRP
jgi:hypothetical protein